MRQRPGAASITCGPSCGTQEVGYKHLHLLLMFIYFLYLWSDSCSHRERV